MTSMSATQARMVHENRKALRFAYRVAQAAAGVPLPLSGPGMLRYWPPDWPGIDPTTPIFARRGYVFAMAAHDRRHEPAVPGGVACLWTVGPMGVLP